MRSRARPKKVMVFGVFDRLHPGHLSFLKQAKKYGEELIVALARDSVVRELKNKTPSQNERERMAVLRKIPDVNKVVLGDKKQGSYGVIKKYKPDMICLGYDQNRLAKNLRERMRSALFPSTHLVRLKAYYSRKFHTSKLENKNLKI